MRLLFGLTRPHTHTHTFTIAHTHWLTSHREKVNQSLLYNDELRRRRRTAGMARFFRGLLCHFRRTAVVNLMHVALAAHSGTRRALTRHSEHRFAGLKLPISIATAAAGPHPLAHEGCCVKSETALPNVSMRVCVCVGCQNAPPPQKAAILLSLTIVRRPLVSCNGWQRDKS